MHEFVSAIEYFYEILLLIRDMASSTNDRMKSNATILQKKIFSLDVFKLIKFGIETFDSKVHPQYHIICVLRFADLAIMMIDEYSKGRTMTIQTHKKKRRKIEREQLSENEEMLGDAMQLISDEEDDMEEVAVERDFHFNVEIAKLIDQKIVNNILDLVKYCEDIDQGIVSAIAHLFNRMMKQCNGTFIFYQLYAMDIFETFLISH